MLGDREELKWPKAQNREGAMSIISLTTGCPSRIRFFAFHLIVLLLDLCLSVSLKIGGHGIQNALLGRRGHSLLRDIGLSMSMTILSGDMRPGGFFLRLMEFYRLSTMIIRGIGQLDFPALRMSSSALREKYVVKYYTPRVQLAWVPVEKNQIGGRSIPPSGVANG